MSPRRQQPNSRSRPAWRRIIFVTAAALLVGVGGATYAHSRNAARHPQAAITPPRQATPVTALSAADIAYLEQALDSDTVTGQRRALAAEFRSSLTAPMFPASVDHRPTTVSIDAGSFKPDPKNSSVATVNATLSNNLGSFTLRLVREAGQWLLAYTTEVGQ